MLGMSVWLWSLLLVVAGLLALWCWLYRPVAPARGRGAELDAGAAPAGSLQNSPAGRLRLVTYNICGGRGLDGRVDLERIARDLEALEADIIGLQEVHNSLARPRQAARLARRLGMALVNGPVRWRGFRRQRGNALLTRLPVGHWRRFPLGRPGWLYTGSGKRLLRQLLTVAFEGGAPTVLVTHLATSKTDRHPNGRPAQLAQVLDELTGHSPAVLLGDLNTRGEDAQLARFLAGGAAVDALGADEPERIDWILLRGVRAVASGRVNSGASDHPLYWCDIEGEDT